MGIPSYFSFIVKNHIAIIKQFSPAHKVNHFYLDCNSIIYDAIHKVDWTENVMKTSILLRWVINKIEEYIRIINPSDTIYIAFDGVAPVAKMEQQRGRRYKSWYQNNITRDIMPKDAKQKDVWNTSAITPGTLFMEDLNSTMSEYFTKNHDKYGAKKVLVSSSEKEGEGEHKMFEYIRANSGDHLEKTSVIYGLDADLIMLSINHLPICPNIFLFRETPHFIQSLNETLEPEETYLLDIPLLAKTITSNMNNGREMTTVQQHNRIYDYILICFMLGNDFLPHFPAINIRTGGIDKLLNAYKATIGGTSHNLTDGKQIFWKHFRKFVEFLAKQEEEFLKNETKLRDRREKVFLPDDTPEMKLKKFDALPTYKRDTEKFINPYRIYWRNRYYTALFNVNIENEERAQQICVNYLEGLEWTMKYYTSGCCDWRWKYNYNYPPLLSDLYKYVPSFDTEYISYKPKNPVSPYVQLCYVLPKTSLHLLPTKIGSVIQTKYGHLYDDNCNFKWSYCKYFWESHVDLPEININELESIINEIETQE